MFEHKTTCFRDPVNYGGATIVPAVMRGQVQINYHGILANSGAQDVYMRVGYGGNGNWEDIYDHKMERTAEGFIKTIQLKRCDYLRFCFKDGADHWDNNNGINWTIDTESY